MKTPAKTFQDLDAWKNAHAFALGVYRLTAAFPADERFGMVNRFRRAAVSIPTNIVELWRGERSATHHPFVGRAESI